MTEIESPGSCVPVAGRFTAALFDLDGTLIDSRAAVLATYREVLRQKFSIELPEPAVETQRRWLAMRPAEVFAEIAPGFVEECKERYARAYLAQSERLCIPMSGARELLAKLAAKGLTLGVVTTKGSQRARWEIDRFSLLADRMSVVIGAEDTEERKPHPAPLLLALKRIGAAAGNTIYVGDGPHDVVAAKAAGLATAAV